MRPACRRTSKRDSFGKPEELNTVINAHVVLPDVTFEEPVQIRLVAGAKEHAKVHRHGQDKVDEQAARHRFLESLQAFVGLAGRQQLFVKSRSFPRALRGETTRYAVVASCFELCSTTPGARIDRGRLYHVHHVPNHSKKG